MKSRFFLVIIMLVVLFGGWLFVSYENSRSVQEKLNDLSQLPVYAYVSDSTKVAVILEQLKPLPGIASVTHETAKQASAELITAYGLPISEEMIADYAFPDVITINLLPNKQGVRTKPLVIDVLRGHITEQDIDSQASAFNNLLAELKLVMRQSVIFNVFAALLMLLIVVFARLSFELHTLLHYQGKKHSVVDRIRHQKQGVEHTWTMLLIPLPLCVILYFGAVYLLQVKQLLPYWVFLAQLGAAAIGTAITYFVLHAFEQEVEYAEHPVQVVSATEKPFGEDDETSDS